MIAPLVFATLLQVEHRYAFCQWEDVGRAPWVERYSDVFAIPAAVAAYDGRPRPFSELELAHPDRDPPLRSPALERLFLHSLRRSILRSLPATCWVMHSRESVEQMKQTSLGATLQYGHAVVETHWHYLPGKARGKPDTGATRTPK